MENKKRMKENPAGLVYLPLTIAEKERKLKFTYNTVADIEEYFGKGIASIFSQENVGFSTIRAFFWYGLKWQWHGLTLQNTGQILHKMIREENKTIEELADMVLIALQRSGVIGKEAEELDDELEEEFLDDEDQEKN